MTVAQSQKFFITSRPRSFYCNLFGIFGSPKWDNPYLLAFFENELLVTFSITPRAVVWIVNTDFLLYNIQNVA